MKIGVKITLLAIVAAVALTVVCVESFMSLGKITNDVDHISKYELVNFNHASEMLVNINAMARQSASMIGGDPALKQGRLEKHTKAYEAIKEHAKAYRETAQTEIGKKLLDSAIIIIEEKFPPRLAELEAAIMADCHEEARKIRDNQSEGSYINDVYAITNISQELYGVTHSRAVEYLEHSHAAAEDAKFVLIITAIIVAITLLIVSIVVIMGITKPLKKAVHAATQVSEGNFDVDLTTNSKDETGMLLRELSVMIQSIESIISDANNVSKEAAEEGNLKAHLDVSKYKGGYKELAQGINNVVDGVMRPVNISQNLIARIAKGDIPDKITTPEKGDILTLRDSFNDCFEALNLIISDLNNSIEKAKAGDLKYRADVSKHQGDYRSIIEGVNQLVEAFILPLQETARFIEDVETGNVEMKPITVELKGEFNVIKNNVNSLHAFLYYFLGEIMKIGEAAKAGNLAARIDTSKARGAWKLMEEAVNAVVDESEKIINDAGKTLSIMATGDLTPRITDHYEGKFRDMKHDINNLGDSLTDLISQLQEAIHTTASASAEISSTADTLAAATQEQSSQTDEVATAMEEMSRTVTDNAHSATQTANVAKQSGDTATSGGKVVEQTISKMKEIAEVVKISAANIAKLGESSKKIGDIISVIDDIADQTNLLSLNAAIEAARAGEQGRGFAVVADSVGKLAVSTASATKEIADMIKGIQVDTEAAVRAMEKGTLEVQSGIELADNAGKSINDILLGINELLDMVNQIAAASEQQSATSEQISKNVSSISKVTSESARNVEDVASTANELARMTETLTSLVSQFKIGSSNTGNSTRLLN